LITQLSGIDLGEELLIPESMLRHGSDVFLDDLTVHDVEKALNVKITATVNNGGEFLRAIVSGYNNDNNSPRGSK